MIPHHIIQTIFVIAGVITTLAALFDWDWFFTAKNAEFIVKPLGRKRSRIIYGAIGLLFIATAVFFYYKVEGIK